MRSCFWRQQSEALGLDLCLSFIFSTGISTKSSEPRPKPSGDESQHPKPQIKAIQKNKCLKNKQIFQKSGVSNILLL